MHEFYHHEDDVCMVQVLPIEWWDYCHREQLAIDQHGEKYRDGAGWTKMHEYRVPDPSLPGLNMTADRFIELLSPHAKQFERIVNPLSEFEAEMGIRAIGFGPSGSTGIIADLDGKSVKAIWCMNLSENDRELDIFADMLIALSRDQHLLLADWTELHNVDLRVRWEIDNYLFGSWPFYPETSRLKAILQWFTSKLVSKS